MGDFVIIKSWCQFQPTQHIRYNLGLRGYLWCEKARQISARGNFKNRPKVVTCQWSFVLGKYLSDELGVLIRHVAFLCIVVSLVEFCLNGHCCGIKLRFKLSPCSSSSSSFTTGLCSRGWASVLQMACQDNS